MADNVVLLQQRPTPKHEIEVSLRPATPCEIEVFIAALDGPRHPEAKARFAAHRARLPETRVHLTPSSGLHFIFRHAWGVRNTQSRLAVGIDTRGEGGFVPKIVPGDIAVTRRANPDGILPTVINNKAAEICSPQLQPNGRDRPPTPDLPSSTPMLLNQHGPTKSMCSCRALQERSGSTERFPQ